MQRLLIIFILTFLFFKAFGQKNKTKVLNVTKEQRDSPHCVTTVKGDKTNDSILLHFMHEIEDIMQSKDIENNTSIALKNKSDSLSFQFNSYQSENKKVSLYHFAKEFYHLNYITKKIKGQENKIILKDHKMHRYFTEVHTLNPKEFLLLERQDDMSFSCNYATVYEVKEDTIFKKNTFKQGEVLSVCSWTHIDESYPVHENGSVIMKGELKSYRPVKIVYNFKTKVIVYSFYKSNDGTLIKRKSKYENGKFFIEDYDVRSFLD
ncbi:hypothetical protein I2486_01085 [Cellulophaga sp. E16_2]|uniref:hypothetical protein n=1 Tax=Cellulophaga sp. E16_2 TaxID=2789297 RepID=UPI001A9213E4|nr:hypothetical protein [Cellulophaga sp. E16_2]MBO0589988.1 hypothetical protein [Cellulophaga sp. E16_2]